MQGFVARVGPAVLVVLLLVGCTAGEDLGLPAEATEPVPAVDTSAVDAEHAETDVRFAQAVLARQQQAAELARMAEEQAGSRGVRRLAREVEEQRAQDILLLTALLTVWGADLPGASEEGAAAGAGGGADGTSEAGGTGEDAVAALPTAGLLPPEDMGAMAMAHGEAFDAAFLQAVLAHHDGVTALARAELADGVNPQARALAEDLLQRRDTEVADAQRLIDG